MLTYATLLCYVLMFVCLCIGNVFEALYFMILVAVLPRFNKELDGSLSQDPSSWAFHLTSHSAQGQAAPDEAIKEGLTEFLAQRRRCSGLIETDASGEEDAP